MRRHAICAAVLVLVMLIPAGGATAHPTTDLGEGAPAVGMRSAPSGHTPSTEPVPRATFHQGDTACFSDAAFDTLWQDGHFEDYQPHIDILETCVDFITETALRFRVRVTDPTDPATHSGWEAGPVGAGLGWAISSTRFPSEYEPLWGINYGDILGNRPGWKTFYASFDDLQQEGVSVPAYCHGPGAFDGTWYSATIPVECIGAPEDFYFSTFGYWETERPGQLSDVGWYDALPQFFDDGKVGPVELEGGLDPCQADVHVIGVRGSGESAYDPRPSVESPGYIGSSMGKVVTDFYDHFQDNLAHAGYTTSYEGLVYPAVKILTAGQVVSLGDRYVNSFNTGIQALSDRWSDRQLRCPGQPIVLVGYSQGGHVVGNFLETWGGGFGDLASVALFAEARFNPRDPAARGTFAGTHDGVQNFINQIWRPGGIAGARDEFPDFLEGRIESYCLFGDTVCTGLGHTTFDGIAIHTGYYTRAVDNPPFGDSTELAAATAAARARRAVTGTRSTQPRGTGGATAVVAQLDGPPTARPGEEVTLYAGASYDEFGEPLRYRFTSAGQVVGEGTRPTVTVTAPPAGQLRVDLTVTTFDDLTVTDSHIIQVDPDSPVTSGPPHRPDVDVDLTAVALEWDAPDDDGGAPVVAYRVEDDNSGEVLLSTDEQDASLRLLGTRNLVIRPITPAGEGEPSPPVEVTGTPVDDDAAAVQRIAGDGRRDTASLMAARTATAGISTVIIARDDSYADALAASGLAGALGAPVLLTQRTTLGAATAGRIGALQAVQAIVVGGPAVIDDAVIDELEDLGLEVERIAGDSRFTTAATVARAVGGNTGLLVLGDHADGDRAWPDAVAASAMAAGSAMPVLLTTSSQLPRATEAAIIDLDLEEVLIIGGTAAVNDTLERQLQGFDIDVVRIAGQSRYATSAQVARDHLLRGADPQVVVVATGHNWPDALTAGPAAALLNAPLVLVDGRTPSGAPEAMAFLRDVNPEQVLVAGGPAAVSSDVAQALQAATG